MITSRAMPAPSPAHHRRVAIPQITMPGRLCRPPAEAPNLITNVATTGASVPDVAMTGPIHDMLEHAGLLPGEHTVDAGYTSADLLLAAQARGITLLGPLLADTSPQARADGYTTAAFTIDWERQQVTCPQDATSIAWSPCRQRRSSSGSLRPPAGPARQVPVHPLIPLRPPAFPAPARCARDRRGRPRWTDHRPVEGNQQAGFVGHFAAVAATRPAGGRPARTQRAVPGVPAVARGGSTRRRRPDPELSRYRPGRVRRPAVGTRAARPGARRARR
jgi:hypothetical protein